ncbi:CDP-glycerol glycerophosphotransferase family protein [Brevibacterium jeotgali]|uniref:CDP-Glycerol:Poly(Glycerophosphate) glycerophosphotransferase n=1 Tax=Brevibacterium jeotgali TaxID=1262550 RepID=A0A2H1L8F7_9MICO|nr:CDP-glycerol glycerophosphotransferase family protein [Brevibacterium jeotgali]TWB98823.1 CDP-glycerol:poly(glycerophosphate) glycerophosphotransferase [Brevibacterium jeotgali]SMY13181.1 CDP-Glycerol:Poly(glycerophosphate) glycerophosphotransferase [Brevibacterium jeotgali]
MKAWAQSQAQALVRSRAWTATSAWIRGGRKRGRPAGHEIHGIPVSAQIVAYFGDNAEKTYQLTQWLPVLEKLNEHHPVLLVFRKLGALREVKGTTQLPMVFVRRFEDLATLYFENDYKLAIYVNNGVTNFQSLSYAPMVHVHVNHGESDKISMVSNQAKAYDKTLIAGRAALERHRAALLDFDESKLIAVGRPQLDVPREPDLPPSGLRTLMYAPTWEGENESNNYTSIDRYGVDIMRALLDVPRSRVLYKPHPRVEDTTDPDIAEADAQIRALIEEAGEPHSVKMQGDILAMFTDVDLLVTDISSVGLDFLYLRPESPLLLTDRRTDAPQLHRDAPISRCTPVIDAGSIAGVDEMVRAQLEADEHRDARSRMRTFYFGEGGIGTSTTAFLTTITELVEERGRKLAAFTRQSSSMEATD